MNSADYQANTPYARLGEVAIEATAIDRRTFIRKTYMHLMVAIYALVMLEFVYFKTLPLDQWVPQVFAQRWGWFALFGAYMVVSTIARNWRNRIPQWASSTPGCTRMSLGFR